VSQTLSSGCFAKRFDRHFFYARIENGVFT
jgi:hypothetical protein